MTVIGSTLVHAISALAGPVSARDFDAVFVNDAVYRVFGNAANAPDGSGTDPFAKFIHSALGGDQFGVAQFAPGAPGSHGGRWAVYRATWNSTGTASELVTSWAEVQSLVGAGEISLVRDPAADFRCPVLGNPQPIG